MHPRALSADRPAMHPARAPPLPHPNLTPPHPIEALEHRNPNVVIRLQPRKGIRNGDVMVMGEVLTASVPMRALPRSITTHHIHLPPPPVHTQNPNWNRTPTTSAWLSETETSCGSYGGVVGAPEAWPPIGERDGAPIHAATSRTSTPPMSEAQLSNADLGSVRDATRSSDWHTTSHT